MEVRLLGPLEIVGNGAEVTLGGKKRSGVLALLALAEGRSVSPDALAEALWGERPPKTAANTLQVYVSTLRKVLNPLAGSEETIVRDGAGYRLALPPSSFDHVRFAELAEEGAALLVRDPPRARETLSAALAVWRGPALADFIYEGWAQTEAARLEELRMVCTERRVDAELACGGHAELVGELEGLVREYPMRERVRGQLMLALYRSGRQADALQSYQEGREALVEELGLDPSAELQALYRAILNQESELRAPVRVEREQAATTLPAPSTPLIGRQDELELLAGFLHDPGVRLITVTGLGGVGKSRLALEAARRNSLAFPDGLYFVELAATNRPALVLSAIAGALGVSDAGTGDDALMQAMKRALQQPTLLVLDNFEHVIAAAPRVAELLTAAPTLKVIATSRAPLRISGEREFRIHPLPVPAAERDDDLEEIIENEAVQLFLERAYPDQRLARDDVDLPAIAGICRRVDGLPLAIELAAARTRLFAPAELLPELDRRLSILVGGSRDRPDRQQALRDTIRWSYDLLAPREQRLFARLAVFTGGFTVASAAAVCNAAFEELETLAEHSLITGLEAGGRTRFSMLETLREFALERLVESGEEATLRRRHLEELVRTFGHPAGIVRPSISAETWPHIAAELDNIRGALAWAVGEGDAALGTELATSLWQYWELGGGVSEGHDWYQALLAREGELDERRVGRLLAADGWLQSRRAEYGDAHRLLGMAADILTTAGDLRSVGIVLSCISYTASWQGDVVTARANAERALSLADRIDDSLVKAEAERALAAVCEEEGDFDASTDHWRRSAELFREAGNDVMSIISDANLGWGLLLAGEYSDAEPILRRAIARASSAWIGLIGLLQTFRQNLAACLVLQARPAEARSELAFVLSSSMRCFQEREIAEALISTAAIAANDGDAERSARLHGAWEGLLEHMGVPPSSVERAIVEHHLRWVEQGGAAVAKIREEGRALTVDAALGEALEVVGAEPAGMAPRS